VYSSQGLKAKS